MTVSDRFWSKVAKGEGCWNWTGSMKHGGRGEFWLNNKKVYAYRMAWELTHGPIPKGLVVCHACDNPSCVRPKHLFLGTQTVNVWDMQKKGRAVSPPEHRGTAQHCSKLNDDAVRKIRKRYAAGGVSQRALAAEYGVTQKAIQQIVVGKAWTHVA